MAPCRFLYGALIVAAASGCRLDDDSLKSLAREARSAGRTTAEFTMLGGETPEGTLAEVLRHSSVVLVGGFVPAVHTTHDSHSILSWHLVERAEVLAVANPGPASDCGISRPNAMPATGYAIPVSGGAATIDGVEITMHGPFEKAFRSSRSFVIIGEVCPGSVLIPLYSTTVYPVSQGAFLVRDTGTSFNAELKALGTVERLRERLR